MKDLEEILKERGKEYGSFDGHASITQSIERILLNSVDGRLHSLGNPVVADTVREGMHMIAHKLARLVNGNPLNIDSWRDIAGYASVTADMIERHAPKTPDVGSR